MWNALEGGTLAARVVGRALVVQLMSRTLRVGESLPFFRAVGLLDAILSYPTASTLFNHLPSRPVPSHPICAHPFFPFFPLRRPPPARGASSSYASMSASISSFSSAAQFAERSYRYGAGFRGDVGLRAGLMCAPISACLWSASS